MVPQDAAFDAKIGDVSALHFATRSGPVRDWTTTRAARSRVLLLVQFAQPVSRIAAGVCRRRGRSRDIRGPIDRGDDRTLDRFERWFLYMPFVHAENLAAQERSLVLFVALAAESGERGNLEWAEKHAVIIRRFGRFPHRNACLGRASTPEEIAFLDQPGSRF